MRKKNKYWLMGFLAATSGACSLTEDDPSQNQVTSASSVSERPAYLEENSCEFKKANLQGTYRGFEIPAGIRLQVPKGTYRYRYEGRDLFPGHSFCRVVVDARQESACGAEIIEVLYRGRSTNSWGSPEPESTWSLDLTDLRPPSYYGVAHVLRSGMTIRSIPGRGGILVPYDEEYKFFGQSIAALDSFEHLRPVFPLAWQKIGCADLKLIDQTPVSLAPYPGISESDL